MALINAYVISIYESYGNFCFVNFCLYCLERLGLFSPTPHTSNGASFILLVKYIGERIKCNLLSVFNYI